MKARRKLRRRLAHRLQAVFARPAADRVGRIDDHRRRRVLHDDVTEHILHRLGAADLRRFDEHDLFRFVVVEFIHHADEIRRHGIAPGARHGGGLRIQHAVSLRPLRNGQVVRRFQRFERGADIGRNGKRTVRVSALLHARFDAFPATTNLRSMADRSVCKSFSSRRITTGSTYPANWPLIRAGIAEMNFFSTTKNRS